MTSIKTLIIIYKKGMKNNKLEINLCRKTSQCGFYFTSGNINDTEIPY
jgi:hypothetical protein